MVTRREALALGAGAVAGMALGDGLLRGVQAQPMASLASLSPANFHDDMLRIMRRTRRVAFPSFRFGVVVRSGISASGNAGNVNVEATADLVGVDQAMLQQLAQQAATQLADQVTASGREVVQWSELSASRGFGRIEQTPAPFIKQPFADARTVAMVAPPGMPLVSLHIDAPLSDKSPVQLGNWRAINAISADLDCLVVIPTLVLDFAQLTGSGHSVYGGAANVGVQPGIFLVPQFTQYNFYHARIALAGDIGRFILEDRVPIGQAGQLVQTSNFNNNAEIEEWNAYANSLRWWNEPNLAGPSRPTRAYNYSTYQYRVDPQAFSAACLDGARAVNGVFMQAMLANPPEE